MKKLLTLLTALIVSITIFAQYTENKLPSGLTVATAAQDADYTIIQKNGETIVKAIRMDSLQSYMVAGMNANIPTLDSVSGQTGQFIISDGSGWLAPASAKYEGNYAYTFGERTGTIGSRSFAISGSALQPVEASGNSAIAGGRLAVASGATSVAFGLAAQATGDESTAIGSNATASGYASFATSYSTASGINAVAINGGIASGNSSLAMNGGTASGTDAISISGSTASGDNSVAILVSNSVGDYSMGLQSGNANGDYSHAEYGADANGKGSFARGSNVDANSFQEIALGAYNISSTPASATTWVLTDKLFSIGNGTSNINSDAMVILKNGNTTFTNNVTCDTLTANHIEQHGSFAEIWVADASTAQNINTGTTYTKLTPFTTDGEEVNCTADAANDKITITETGYYLVNFAISNSCGTNGVTARTAVFLGGSEVDKIHMFRIFTTSTNNQSGAMSGILKIETVPIDLDVRIRHDNVGTIAFTVSYANLSIHKIGDL